MILSYDGDKSRNFFLQHVRHIFLSAIDRISNLVCVVGYLVPDVDEILNVKHGILNEGNLGPVEGYYLIVGIFEKSRGGERGHEVGNGRS